jgi:hypothetical protein
MVPGSGAVPVPAVVAATGPEGAGRFLEFFVIAILNHHTRATYATAVRRFCACSSSMGLWTSPSSSRCMSPPISKPSAAS